jgi:hypothetical protein
VLRGCACQVLAASLTVLCGCASNVLGGSDCRVLRGCACKVLVASLTVLRHCASNVLLSFAEGAEWLVPLTGCATAAAACSVRGACTVLAAAVMPGDRIIGAASCAF